MIYNNLYSEFVKLFPECSDTFKRLATEANADETDGMHIMFSFVIIPFVFNLLNDDDSKKLEKAFDYFEKMASSDSTDITEVLEFTVIENLVSNGKTIYDKAKTYMNDTMLACCNRIEQYLKVAK